MKELSMRELCLSDKTGHIQGGTAVGSYVFQFPLPYRQCRYILRQLWQQPSGHVLVSSFVQLAFWHFSAETESSAVHAASSTRQGGERREPATRTRRRRPPPSVCIFKCPVTAQSICRLDCGPSQVFLQV